MFNNAKMSWKFAGFSTKWIEATGVDPGDNGQISVKARDYVQNVGLTSEDAWLTALVNWIIGMPWPKEQKMLASNMRTFLNRYRGVIHFSEECAQSALQVTDEIRTK